MTIAGRIARITLVYSGRSGGWPSDLTPPRPITYKGNSGRDSTMFTVWRLTLVTRLTKSRM